MPDRTIDFGKFGARGVKAHEAVSHQLDQLAGFITSPITTRRGLLARLHYLTRSNHARQAAHTAGLTVTDRTLKAWLQGKRNPTKKNLQRIETAYHTLRRQNVARYLLTRLNRNGQGTRVEIHPLNQSHVPRPHQRTLQHRTLNVRHWNRIIDAWTHTDTQALDNAWINDAATHLGSSWGQYDYVTTIGFAA
ncbi:transcriptional regulator [Streptomyces griseoviridis]